MLLLNTKFVLRLDSRKQNQIDNTHNLDDLHFGQCVECEDYKKKFGKEQHRPTESTDRYNCHGLTFGARRTKIWQPEAVVQIIKEDDYLEVPYTDVWAGDVAVYYNAGDPEHSGIVISRDEMKVPVILSKWGACHEVVHRMAQCPYNSSDVKFYRILK